MVSSEEMSDCHSENLDFAALNKMFLFYDIYFMFF